MRSTLSLENSELLDAIPIPSAEHFVFNRCGSLEGLIDFWDRRLAENPLDKTAAEIMAAVAGSPRLRDPFHQVDEIESYRTIVGRMMEAVIPSGLHQRALAAVLPFSLEPIFCTPSFAEMLSRDRRPDDSPGVLAARNLGAYGLVLKEIYGISSFSFSEDFVWRLSDESGLDTFQRISVDRRFLRVSCRHRPPEVCRKSFDAVSEDLSELSRWLERIDPSLFEFSGFALLEARDVTEQESVSQLKNLLLDRDVLLDEQKFEKVRRQLANLVRMPGLHLGVGVVEPDQVTMFNPGFDEAAGTGLRGMRVFPIDTMTSPTSRRLLEEQKPMVIGDLATAQEKPPFAEALLARGLRNLVLLPLLEEGRTAAVLELCSPEPDWLTAFCIPRLTTLATLFLHAASRTAEELGTRLQAVMKEEFTAIHPCVEWRFRRAAQNLLQERQLNEEATVEEIVFEGVYPLFGSSDIRGSSAARVEAISQDLAHQFRLAREALDGAYGDRQLPYLDEMRFRVETWQGRIDAGLASGDEVQALDFLTQTVEPLLKKVRDFGNRSRWCTDAYFQSIDPERGILYQSRRRYDSSVTRIREVIASYLAREQERAQQMFPHYFELQKTDGVDHNAYIGSSLVAERRFDRFYLRNLRLWQLMVMCVVARKTNDLKEELEVPLETAHLILVQNQPMTIRFQVDEKQFGVDGAYDIRYHLVKKRLDKAVVAETHERLTQPGKVAIVYSQPQEAEEYLDYLDYLQSLGYVVDAVERLELGPLEGVSGLRALRVKVGERAGLTGTTIERTLDSLAH